MHHTMQISVTKKPNHDGVASFKNVSIREKLLRYLFGEKAKLTVIVPGDTVDEVAITEKTKGGKCNVKAN